ncbi:MAG: hypothetical protein RL518_1010 [Pseudomonadota bacterium]|jgi:hypothetical protein
MFLWSDPFKQTKHRETHAKAEQDSGLVSARWLALDSILRSLILDPEGPEMRAMMKRDLHIMYATGQFPGYCYKPADAYQEAAGVMLTWRKSLP